MPTRRQFLGLGLSAGLVYGLYRLVDVDEPITGGASPDPAADPPSAPLRAYDASVTAARDAALEHARRIGTVVIGIAVPEDTARRQLLGQLLTSALAPEATPFSGPNRAGPMSRLERNLISAVYVCAPASQLPFRAGETAILLDAVGARAAGSAETLDSRDALDRVIELLLYGEGRLAERARVAREALSPAAAASLDDPEQLMEVHHTLAASWPRFAPAVELALREHEGKAGAFAYDDQFELFASVRPLGVAHGVPHFGLRWRFDPEVPVRPEPCPPCGMVAIPPRSRLFVEFFTR